MKRPWWEHTDVTRAASARGSVEQIALFSLLSMALKDNLCVYEHSRDGNLSIAPDDFLKQISELGGRIISRSLNKLDDIGPVSASSTSDHIITWEHAILSVTFDADDWVYIKTSSLDKTLVDKIKTITEKNIVRKKKGKAYVFVSGEGGPELRQIPGKAGVELERDNYTQDILNDYDHIVRDLQSPNPCAKLIIADGEPGTGKTYLVRGITDAVDGATFVLVPPAMISDIMSPQFIPVLMDHHHDNTETGPIVFIVEDADACLVKREGDNMNSISSLLNLGAGMFGDLFDVRVIATTNAKKIDMDPAITRNGRTCRYIETGVVPREQAEKIYQKLVSAKGKDLSLGDKYCTLANIYHAAREDNDDQKKAIPKKAKVGF